MKLDINVDKTVVMSARLERMKKTAIPAAVRGALNAAAFDVKKDTMPASAARAFVQRNPNFFKATSKVDMARGSDVNSMEATIGFAGKGTADQATKELEQQERGGEIKKRSFVPMTTARGGGAARPVRPGNRLSKISNIVNAAKTKASNAKQAFLAAAAKAGKGGYVIGNNPQRTLWRIRSIDRGRIKKEPLYSFRDNRSINVKATGFMERASLESGSKIDDFYIKECKRQFSKL